MLPISLVPFHGIWKCTTAIQYTFTDVSNAAGGRLVISLSVAGMRLLISLRKRSQWCDISITDALCETKFQLPYKTFQLCIHIAALLFFCSRLSSYVFWRMYYHLGKLSSIDKSATLSESESTKFYRLQFRLRL